jgi:hypothetical protein
MYRRTLQPVIILSFLIPETEKTGTDISVQTCIWQASGSSPLDLQAILPEVSRDIPHDTQQSAGNVLRKRS